jgi:hypothetical protein
VSSEQVSNVDGGVALPSPDPVHRRSRKTVAILIAALTLIVTGGALVAVRESSSDSASLEPERPRRTFYVKLFPTEKAFTVSTLFINDGAGKEIEILEVRPLGSPNLDYLGAITVWPRNGKDSTFDGGEGFPADAIRTYHPALGTVIPASETGFVHPDEAGKPRPVVVNAGFRLTGGSVGFVNGVEVVYRVGNDKRSERARTAIIACMNPCAERGAVGSLSEWERSLRDTLGLQELRLVSPRG